MFNKSKTMLTLSLATLALASCGASSDVETEDRLPRVQDISSEEHGSFNEPWGAEFIPGTTTLVITEKSGQVKAYDTASKTTMEVAGAPEVDYGGQGGLGDVAFLASETGPEIGKRTIYLTWAEAGSGDTRGAALGKGVLDCTGEDGCAIRDLAVVWRQTPKVTGRGHYSHRIAFSPDGEHLFLTSGDRQKMEPAQDNENTIGTIVRLNLDGSAAQGNPFADQGSPSDQIWSYGHRNLLGIAFDMEGQLWDVEHGPAGGDELNLVKPGLNYGWPTVSDGEHYNGDPIPDHDTDPSFAKYAITWTPVIAPGDMTIYRGDLFTGWKGDALIAAMGANGLVQIELDGEQAREVARHDLGERIRAVVEAADGSLWVLEDGPNGRLLRLTPGK
jgi:glucose/arabinose dehydrogenase